MTKTDIKLVDDLDIEVYVEKEPTQTTIFQQSSSTRSEQSSQNEGGSPIPYENIKVNPNLPLKGLLALFNNNALIIWFSIPVVPLSNLPHLRNNASNLSRMRVLKPWD